MRRVPASLVLPFVRIIERVDAMTRLPGRPTLRLIACCFLLGFVILALNGGATFGQDLPEVRQKGTLRHLGVVYANFVTGSGDGFSIELMQGFADDLGVDYEFIPTTWGDVIGDLTGVEFSRDGNEIEITGSREIRGDVISNGLTRLPWREKLIAYSDPVFPTQVWVIVTADSPLEPIATTGPIDEDIRRVKSLLVGRSVICMPGTCLDAKLYDFAELGIRPVNVSGNMNKLVPRLFNKEADATILDVPDALLAIRTWPGEIKIIGPVSPDQVMGVGFRPESTRLRAAFAEYFDRIKKDGTYERLLKKYYPAVFHYYPEFFESQR